MVVAICVILLYKNAGLVKAIVLYQHQNGDGVLCFDGGLKKKE